MHVGKVLLHGLPAVALATGLVAPATATTLIRASLDDLTKANSTVVVGEVVDAYSYWNSDGNFILTDVRIAPIEVVKGKAPEGDLTVTLMGGTVGDLTTLILGGAELTPGKSYLLFVNDEDLPGAKGVPTILHHSQGVFDVVHAAGEIRAISQASGSRLVPDTLGRFEAPGGTEGFEYEALVQSVRELVNRQEVRK